MMSGLTPVDLAISSATGPVSSQHQVQLAARSYRTTTPGAAQTPSVDEHPVCSWVERRQAERHKALHLAETRRHSSDRQHGYAGTHAPSAVVSSLWQSSALAANGDDARLASRRAPAPRQPVPPHPGCGRC